MINEQEWDFHVKICPDRGVVDNYIYAMSNKNSLVIELPPEPVVPPNEENWDDVITIDKDYLFVPICLLQGNIIWGP